MTIKTEFSTYRNVFLGTNRYCADNSLYICAWNEEDGPIADITVCLDDSFIKENESYVDTNNFPGVMEFIEKYKLGKPTGLLGFSGYCCYPLVEFDMDAIDKYTYKGDK